MRLMLKTCSEPRADLDKQTTRQSRALEIVMEMMQARFETMFEHERVEVRKNMMAMKQMGMRCSEMVNQTAEASAKFATIMGQRHVDCIEAQTPAGGGSQTKKLTGNANKEVSFALGHPSAGSNPHSSTSHEEGNAHIMERLLRVEKRVESRSSSKRSPQRRSSSRSSMTPKPTVSGQETVAQEPTAQEDPKAQDPKASGLFNEELQLRVWQQLGSWNQNTEWIWKQLGRNWQQQEPKPFRAEPSLRKDDGRVIVVPFEHR